MLSRTDMILGAPLARGRAALATLTAVSVLALSSAAAMAQDYDPQAVVNIGSLYEPQNLDNTQGAGQGINEAFNGNVYEGLFVLTDDGDVEPKLVDSYEISDDGLTYTFTLKDGVTFHSGEAMTSADVKSSIERVTAENSASSRKKTLAVIDSIETPDDKTVVVTLSAPSISLPYNLSYVWIVNDDAGDISASEDGTGPYTLQEWRRGSALAMVPFEDYWGEEPTNGGVMFQYFTDATAQNNALLTGAVDIITSVQSPDALSMFTDNPDFTVSEGASTTKELMAYNDRVAPFDNAQVRAALSRAVDKEKLLQAIWEQLWHPDRVLRAADRPLVRRSDRRERLRSGKRQGDAGRGGLSRWFLLHPRHAGLRSASRGCAVPAERAGQDRRGREDQHHHGQRVVHQDLQGA